MEESARYLHRAAFCCRFVSPDNVRLFVIKWAADRIRALAAWLSHKPRIGILQPVQEGRKRLGRGASITELYSSLAPIQKESQSYCRRLSWPRYSSPGYLGIKLRPIFVETGFIRLSITSGAAHWISSYQDHGDFFPLQILLLDAAILQTD